MSNPKTKRFGGVEYLLYNDNGTGRRVYYNRRMRKAFAALDMLKSSNYHVLYVYNRLKTLTNGAEVFHASQSRSDHTAFRLNIAGSTLHYQIVSGVVYVHRLVLDDRSYQEDFDKQRAPGLYSVRYEKTKVDTTGWTIRDSIAKVETTHAAVNGEVMNVNEVLNFMPKMIEKGYPVGAEALKASGYSLFYAPMVGGMDEGWASLERRMRGVDGVKARAEAREFVVGRLSAAIELAGRSGKDVRWTVQGAGSILFNDALEQLHQRAQADPVDLSRQEAHFFNAHSDIKKIEQVVKRLGMQEPVGGLVESNLLSATQRKANKASHGDHFDQLRESKGEGRASSNAKKSRAMVVHRSKDFALVTGLGGATYKAGEYAYNTYANYAVIKSNAMAWGKGAVDTLTSMTLDQVPGEALNAAAQWGPEAIGGLVTVAGGYFFFRAGYPKMRALLALRWADAGKGSRFLDQLTTRNDEDAFHELLKLRQGKAL